MITKLRVISSGNGVFLERMSDENGVEQTIHLDPATFAAIAALQALPDKKQVIFEESCGNETWHGGDVYWKVHPQMVYRNKAN